MSTEELRKETLYLGDFSLHKFSKGNLFLLRNDFLNCSCCGLFLRKVLHYLEDDLAIFGLSQSISAIGGLVDTLLLIQSIGTVGGSVNTFLCSEGISAVGGLVYSLLLN